MDHAHIWLLVAQSESSLIVCRNDDALNPTRAKESINGIRSASARARGAWRKATVSRKSSTYERALEVVLRRRQLPPQKGVLKLKQRQIPMQNTQGYLPRMVRGALKYWRLAQQADGDDRSKIRVGRTLATFASHRMLPWRSYRA